jgi:hypothetical protein
MRLFIRPSVLVLALGCLSSACGSSSNSSTTSDEQAQDEFAGKVWSLTQEVVTSCPNTTPVTQTSTISITFSLSGAGLKTTSSDGCTFDLSLAGDRGSIEAGANVQCSRTAGKDVAVDTFTSFSAETSDGVHLTLMAAGTSTTNSLVCDFKITGTGTS